MTNEATHEREPQLAMETRSLARKESTGIGRMRYAHFATYNVTGAITWVVSLLLAGYWFGRLPVVEKHFELVVVAIVVISLAPIARDYLRSRRARTTVSA